MQEHEVIERICALCEARSWTYYRLAKESNITYSTLCTMLHKSYAPSISTLIKICDGFGITLAQFFGEDMENVLLTAEQKEHIRQWDILSAENKVALEKYMRFLISEQEQK